MRIVANLVRGQRVDTAMAMLKHTPKAAAQVIEKVLQSAVANAENNQGATDVDALIVSSCTIDGGSILKRWMPRAMGRANRIQRRTSHVTIIVVDQS